MKQFCRDQIRTDPRLRAEQGILKSADMLQIIRAQDMAGQIVAEARVKTLQARQQALEECQALLDQKKLQCQQGAMALLQALKDERERFFSEAGELVLTLVRAMFDRLVGECTPKERLLAALRHVMQEMPPDLHAPVLKVHPADLEHLSDQQWEVQADVRLTPGSCSLETATGVWHVDFALAVEELRSLPVLEGPGPVTAFCDAAT
ncbi:FliH/SctL family protein [Undibacterium sp. TS12]|uniref:FliH/SctL family protein n=1 Tax=Undibacterium sp. TS12 TaxID=2908202 RepID=UPI001F4CBC5B|nr:FliH/SctL family protein [Undibacterium sp. TS12]MCH8621985.1 flagellar assembly protein FliH [Undibacterium sp. TS12]